MGLTKRRTDPPHPARIFYEITVGNAFYAFTLLGGQPRSEGGGRAQPQIRSEPAGPAARSWFCTGHSVYMYPRTPDRELSQLIIWTGHEAPPLVRLVQRPA